MESITPISQAECKDDQSLPKGTVIGTDSLSLQENNEESHLQQLDEEINVHLLDENNTKTKDIKSTYSFNLFPTNNSQQLTVTPPTSDCNQVYSSLNLSKNLDNEFNSSSNKHNSTKDLSTEPADDVTDQVDETFRSKLIKLFVSGVPPYMKKEELIQIFKKKISEVDGFPKEMRIVNCATHPGFGFILVCNTTEKELSKYLPQFRINY